MNKKTLNRRTLSIFWQHAKRYRWQMAVVLCGVLGYTFFITYTPLLYRNLLNTLAGGPSGATVSAAIRIILIILAANLTRNAIWRTGLFVNDYFQPKVMYDLTNTCYEYLHQHSYGFFTSKFVGSLVTKVKRFERSFEVIAEQVMFNLGRSILDVGMIVTVLLWQYRLFGLVVLGWCLIFSVFSVFVALYKLPYDLKRAEADTTTTAQLADSITNNINIKLFTNFLKEKGMFGEVAYRQFKLRKKTNNIGTISDAVQGLMGAALEFGVMYLAIRSWRNGTLNIGDVALLQAYLLRIFDNLWDTGKNVRNIYEALADASEMTEILLTPHEVQDAPAAKKLVVRKGELDFRNISFGYYRETPVLKNFDLKISPGERIALIGPSGGGKSTIVKLLFRFHDLQSGHICIDGQDISMVTQDSLRAKLALVPQDPILFHRSLMDNIRYARPGASDRQVIRAAKMAHAHEFISSFRDGYGTLVGERGIKLSGGERQRVAIARAILKDAPILVLDEATSSLDSESELYIQDALKKLMKDRTTIVVAHRLSTIMQMDRIVVVSAGKVIEEGRHDELLKVKKGLYQKLWEIQVGGFGSAVPSRGKAA